ncbi:MAG TPA: hypothetical protein VEF53_07445 [Patescibacteria group bacterium]|nr:hypothetical protein [Patescibacteria group bacterium]
MKKEHNIIHIDWDGPYSLEELSKVSDEVTDHGIYQIYGNHPIYGSTVLLYIGKAVKQTFGKRISQEKWGNTNNYELMQVYVGRLSGGFTPLEEIWSREINLAEKLLIYAHKPAYNAMSVNQMPDKELNLVHILNWGMFNNLMPEVSGARWTSEYDDIPNYNVYGEHDE